LIGASRAIHATLVDENAATLVEYGIIIALVAGAAFAAVLLFGTSVNGLYTKFLTKFNAA
jgi:Flp pilus assembly pilin Flp